MAQLALLVGTSLFVSTEAWKFNTGLTRWDGIFHDSVSLTATLKCCQPWYTEYNPELFHKSNFFQYNRLQHLNYCRLTDGDIRPWCYTMDKNTRWEYCNPETVRKAHNHDWRLTTCVKYDGWLSTTKSGYTCQNWNSQHPHTHDRTPTGSWNGYGFADGRLGNHNYCRNPEREIGGTKLWCYTTNPAVRWEDCNRAAVRWEDHLN